LHEAALAVLLARDYDLGARVSCRLHLERLNDTYCVDSIRGRYVLRVYRHGWRSAAEVQAEVDLLFHLQAEGLPVAAPVPRWSGGYVTTIAAPEGERYAVLFEFAPGRSVRATDPDSYTPERARRMGDLAARIHLAADKRNGSLDRPSLDAAELLERPLETAAHYFDHKAQDMAWLRACAGRLANEISSLPTGSPQYGICHGDIQLSNVNFDEDDSPTIFDFDLSVYGWRTWDLAIFQTTVFSFLSDNGRQSEIWDAFLEGYSQVRAPSAEEMRSMPFLVAAHLIHFMGICVGLRLNTGDYWIPGRIDRTFQRLKEWVENHWD
jgi:Ser/Thr protein kinase RdoA (MazF antagonist)